MQKPDAPACPVCGRPGPHRRFHSHTDPFGGKTYGLFACSSCGADFSDPMLNPGPAWYAAASPSWSPPGPAQVPFWRLEELRSLREALPAGAKLLELGCSDGAFLLAAQACGFEAHGVDFDPAATARARAAGLSRVLTASFEDFFAAGGGPFDAVIFFQTLEHQQDPRAFLAQAAALLKPGGLILFDIPDADRPLPAGSGLIDLPPHHLTRWRRATVAKFLAAAGFEPLSLRSAASYDLLRGAVGAALATALGRLRRRLAGPARAAAGAAAPGAAPAVPSVVPSAAFRFFDLVWRGLAAPLLAPFLLAWLLLLKARGGGFYLCCRAIKL